MTVYRVLLGTADTDLATMFADMGRESGEFEVAQVAASTSEVDDRLDDDIDVAVLHETLGPVPALDLARELSVRAPDTGLVLLTRDANPTLLDAALRSGFRGIVRLPLTLDELATTITAAGEWTAAVRRRVAGIGEDARERAGRMIAIAGGKGGVGATTTATHLAIAAVRGEKSRRVCLVDFDLQKGDVRSMLNLPHRRSIADLVGVAAELSGRQLDESLSVHASGLRVLLPPHEGELGEDVDATAARHILGGLRSRFDVVIVDVGAVATEANCVAVEMADQVIVVTTPDVLALRATNRLIGLWDRLQVRRDGIRALVNRASRDTEIQPEMVRRILRAEPLETTVPSSFWSLEAATNTGAVDRLDGGPTRGAIDGLAAELALARVRKRGRLSRRSEAGSVSVESVGLLSAVLLVVLLLWQFGLAGFTYVLASHTAREVAHELAVTSRSGLELQQHLDATARGAVPSGWHDGLQVARDDARVAIRLSVPVLVPGVSSPLGVWANTATVREHNARDASPGPPAGTLAAGGGGGLP